MAGRGTDIVLGGSWQAKVEKLDNPTQDQIDAIKAEWKQVHDQVLQAGGLHIIGTERHESRRIDNQLRGRSGRQGDAVHRVSISQWKIPYCVFSPLIVWRH